MCSQRELPRPAPLYSTLISPASRRWQLNRRALRSVTPSLSAISLTLYTEFRLLRSSCDRAASHSRVMCDNAQRGVMCGGIWQIRKISAISCVKSLMAPLCSLSACEVASRQAKAASFAHRCGATFRGCAGFCAVKKEFRRQTLVPVLRCAPAKPGSPPLWSSRAAGGSCRCRSFRA